MKRIGSTVAVGQASVEFVLVTFLLALLLVLGPDSALERLFRAVGGYHSGYASAIAQP